MIYQGLGVSGKGILSKHLDETAFKKLVGMEVTGNSAYIRELEEAELLCGCEYYF